MTIIDVSRLEHREINEKLRSVSGDCIIEGCIGQRFIAAGMSGKNITIDGIPGNALGAYLNGAVINVNSNAQDAVGDTMNDGKIVIHGSIGDAAGYAMRGGKIYVRGDAGYRAGIHMKEYRDKIPVMIIGGKTGSFLGEYQAGGIIIVLDIDQSDHSAEFNGRKRQIVGNFPCTGMHGGRLYLRGTADGIVFPKNVCVNPAGPDDIEVLSRELSDYCAAFGLELDDILDSPFTVVTPDSKNPYKQMYVAN